MKEKSSLTSSLNEQFEKCWKEHKETRKYSLAKIDGAYTDKHTYVAWKAFQMAFDSLFMMKPLGFVHTSIVDSDWMYATMTKKREGRDGDFVPLYNLEDIDFL